MPQKALYLHRPKRIGGLNWIKRAYIMEGIKEVVKDEGGQFSSKRVAAFLTLIYTLAIYAVRGESMDYDIFLTLMAFVTGALGITGVEKIALRSRGKEK